MLRKVETNKIESHYEYDVNRYNYQTLRNHHKIHYDHLKKPEKILLFCPWPEPF